MTRIATFPPLLRHPRSLEVATLVALVAGSFGPSAAQTPGDPAAAPLSQALTLKSTARLVNIDVVITDVNGSPVIGLTRNDFQVEEDKVPQPLRSFDVHTAESTYAAPKIPDLPPNTFLNAPTSQDSAPATVLLYDMLNGSSMYSREQFLAFVKQHPSSGRVAIFGLSDRLYLIQGFTEQLSPEQVYEALLRVAQEGRRNPVQVAYDPTARNVRVRGLVTLDALSGVGRFLAPVGGRKTLIWYTAGFAENWTPGNPMPPGPMGKSSSVTPAINYQFPPMYQDEFRKAVDLLALSHVTVYPVDVRGVSGGGPFNGARMLDVKTALHSTMDTFADATGGHAFYGTNDLQGAVEQALNDGSTYYSLTYEPTNPKYDGSLRHIKVTLKKPGYNLSYRKTYFADDLNAVAHTTAEAPESPLTSALERGL